MDFHQACGEVLLLLEVKLVRWLEFSGELSQACGEPWKVYEGFDFTTAREEIKVHRLEIKVVKRDLARVILNKDIGFIERCLGFERSVHYYPSRRHPNSFTSFSRVYSLRLWHLPTNKVKFIVKHI